MCRRARPTPLVEPAENDEIGLLQAGFDQSPDRQARMATIKRAHDNAGCQRLEQGRVVLSGQVREIPRRIDQLVIKAGRGFACHLAPQPVGARFVIGSGEPLGSFDMRGHEPAQRHRGARQEFGEVTQARLQAADKAVQLHAFSAGDGRSEPGKAG